MFLKLIQCTTDSAKRSLFAQAQARWARLADATGFIAQTGGFLDDKPDVALIVALWSSRDALSTFTTDLHDALFEATGQRDTYTSSEISVFRCVLDVRGNDESDRFPDSVKSAALLRVDDFRVRTDRETSFMRAQIRVWSRETRRPRECGAASLHAAPTIRGASSC